MHELKWKLKQPWYPSRKIRGLVLQFLFARSHCHRTKLVVPCGQSMYPQVYGFLGYKPSGGVATPFAGFNSTAATIGHIFPSILHKDAFLIFRALCKLSMKNATSDNGSTTDPIALQNKYDCLLFHLSIIFCFHFLLEFFPLSSFFTSLNIADQHFALEINLSLRFDNICVFL
jgi:hypothetical protein